MKALTKRSTNVFPSEHNIFQTARTKRGKGYSMSLAENKSGEQDYKREGKSKVQRQRRRKK